MAESRQGVALAADSLAPTRILDDHKAHLRIGVLHMMLKHTLLLPETDVAFSAKALKDAIADLEVILMLIFGNGPKHDQIIEWADQLCAGTGEQGFRKRRVVWVRDPAPAEIRAIIAPIFGEERYPVVAVLNFHDELKERLDKIDEIDPMLLEIAFLSGYQA